MNATRAKASKPRQSAVKVYKFNTIEACLKCEDDRVEFVEPVEFWKSWLDMNARVELPDKSQWGPLFPGTNRRGPLFRPYHLPYIDAYNRHVNRRHRDFWEAEPDAVLDTLDDFLSDDVFFVVRADRPELTKMFCQYCGWLDPVQDPEIAATKVAS